MFNKANIRELGEFHDAGSQVTSGRLSCYTKQNIASDISSSLSLLKP